MSDTAKETTDRRIVGDLRNPSAARWIAACAVAVLLTGCGPMGVSFGDTLWPNGDVAVLVGEHDSERRRHGLWVYYLEDGTVEYERQRSDDVFIATGVYEHGVRVRLPTAEELERARVLADVRSGRKAEQDGTVIFKVRLR